MRRLSNCMNLAHSHFPPIIRLICSSSISHSGKKGSSPASLDDGIFGLSPLFPSGQASLEDCRIEVVDNEAFRVSSSLAEAWRGNVDKASKKKKKKALVSDEEEEGGGVKYEPLNKEDPDFDEIEEMRIRGNLFYKVDKDSKEYEECKFEFQGRNRNKGEKKSNARKMEKGSALASENEKWQQCKKKKEKEKSSGESSLAAERFQGCYKDHLSVSGVCEFEASAAARTKKTHTSNQATTPFWAYDKDHRLGVYDFEDSAAAKTKKTQTFNQISAPFPGYDKDHISVSGFLDFEDSAAAKTKKTPTFNQISAPFPGYDKDHISVSGVLDFEDSAAAKTKKTPTFNQISAPFPGYDKDHLSVSGVLDFEDSAAAKTKKTPTFNQVTAKFPSNDKIHISVSGVCEFDASAAARTKKAQTFSQVTTPFPGYDKDHLSVSRLHEFEPSAAAKPKRTPTFNQITAPYHEPFCLDIYVSKGSVRASIIHRATSKVVAVAHSISKDMKFDLGSTKNRAACAAVGQVLAQRALADDIHNAVYTPRKGEKLEGKLQIVLKAVVDGGIDVKVKLKQIKPKKSHQKHRT